jgi:hypothetical protein
MTGEKRRGHDLYLRLDERKNPSNGSDFGKNISLVERRGGVWGLITPYAIH